jgi:hypothetical protein
MSYTARVRWTDTRTNRTVNNAVQIITGHTTTDDIPAILSFRYGVPVENIALVEVSQPPKSRPKQFQFYVNGVCRSYSMLGAAMAQRTMVMENDNTAVVSPVYTVVL